MHRRKFLQSALGAGAVFGAGVPLPAWARPASMGNLGIPALSGKQFDLSVSRFPVVINGKFGFTKGVNGMAPAPLIRFREGETVTINVTNNMDEDTSIHWHGLLVPFPMDGVPGVTYPGIKPGDTFRYRFAVPQNGTYWYHSHSGLQEQVGHHGPLIVDPTGNDPIRCDREYVLLLSDWTYMDPHRLFSILKNNAESLNRQQRTLGDFLREMHAKGLGNTVKGQAMWARMRMNQRDLADVTGQTYTYLVNGHATNDNFNMLFRPGERVRLRIINGSAMTFFNIRIPGLPMTVVQNDGQNVVPVETDEFQIGVAETYDVIIEPREETPFAFVAEAMDRSGQVVATLGPEPGMRARAPKIRKAPNLTMRDMGMAMHMGYGGMKMADMNMGESADKPMDHEQMKHDAMQHGGMGPDPHGPPVQIPVQEADVKIGPGVAKRTANPVRRLDEPGLGLENVGHRALCYSQLKSLTRNLDTRPPGREVVVHLTSSMERYMWSFDGVRFSEVKKSIRFHRGERIRLTLVNDTMMPHPIHLHGMFFELENGHGAHNPRKHTVIVKPAEILSVIISAEHVGDWAFHCHLLYHMHAGMMQVVSILPTEAPSPHHEMHPTATASPVRHSAKTQGVKS